MLTWLNFRLIMTFPFVLFFVFILPFSLPAISFELLGEAKNIATTAYPRQWILNTLVFPVLPETTAINLKEWWMQTNYLGELGLQILISINFFIPFAIIQFWVFDGLMRVRNWYYVKRFEVERTASKTS